jgi:hypothetical protein
MKGPARDRRPEILAEQMLRRLDPLIRGETMADATSAALIMAFKMIGQIEDAAVRAGALRALIAGCEAWIAEIEAEAGA